MSFDFLKNKYPGFKLISLELKNNSLLGKSNLFYNFIDQSENNVSIYTTVIIGPNGTGKSNLFRIIIELFKEIYDMSNGKNRSYSVDGNYRIKFSINGDIFEYANFITNESSNNANDEPEKGIPAFLLKNGKKLDFARAQFPLAIVANSIMLTDKYPFYRKETNKKGEKIDTFPFYKYLGVRNIPQSASTRAYVRRTVEYIVEEFEKKRNNKVSFISALKRATDFLEIDNSIDIFYYTSNNAKFFKGNLTPKGLEEYFEPIRKKYPKADDNPPFKLNQYLKIKNDKKLVRSICDFCNRLVKEEKLEKLTYPSSIRKITYNFIEPELFEELHANYTMLEHLRQLGIISSPEIQLKRAGSFPLQESSSGEYHFFSSIVGLLATITTNSLILIDEPEISLHPNWQMKYLSFLRELFSTPEYASCHIIVATHSHFLISDLKGDSSKIIGLKRTSKEIEIVDLPVNLNTFGWSAEDVLFRVFNVKSTRNHYYEMVVADLLYLLYQQNKDNNTIQLIRAKVNDLKNLKVSEDDPIRELIIEAETYINQ